MFFSLLKVCNETLILLNIICLKWIDCIVLLFDIKTYKGLKLVSNVCNRAKKTSLENLSKVDWIANVQKMISQILKLLDSLKAHKSLHHMTFFFK